jgi:AcrR family transcriptional regulator
MGNERTFVFISRNLMTGELPLSKSERTRAEIIEAAHDLFIQHGFHGTSMRQIATQANLALGGIYNHFASKEDLFREVVLAYHPYHEILPIIANTDYETLADLLHNAASLINETLSARPDIFNLMFIEMVEFKSQHLPELFERVFPAVQKILLRFMEAGDVTRTIPIPMLMRTFFGTILGYFLTKIVLGDNVSPEFRENALHHFVDIYLHGILKPETPS